MWWLQTALGLALLPKIWAQTDAFEFSWPGNTNQCGTYDLAWNGGLPPFRAFFVPIDGAPMVYDLPDSAYSGGRGRYPILHQFAEDTPYVVYMSDGNGDGTGGSSILQVTHPGSSCELSNSSNHTTQSFSFNASGSLAQCSNNFNLDWGYSADNAPYNVSIVPLDQSFRPFTVRMSDRSQGNINWIINLQAGINFTIMFNDNTGYGTGGTGGIYRVNLDTDMPSNCGALVLAAAQNPLPAGLTTASLPPAPSTTGSETASVTGSRTGRPTGSEASGDATSSSGISGGAIAGIVIGVIAGLLLLLLLLFCLYRRRRNRDVERLPDHASQSSPDEMQETNRNSVGVLPASISLNLTYGHGHSRNPSTSTPQLANFGGFEQSEVPRDDQPTVVPFMPQSTSMSPSSSDEQAEVSRRRSKLAMSMSTQPTLRVSNGFTESSATPISPTRETAATRRSTMDLSSLDIPEDDSTTTYRRMTDGGRFVASPEEGGRTVDLPPLYNDIPRDGPAGERRD